jgi:hypothetical protein
MIHPQQDPPTAIMHKIMTAIQACYGDLTNPNFRKVSTFLDSNPYQPLIASLKSSGVTITETTDLNDDVSVQLIGEKDGDDVAIELSGVGPFAVVRLAGTDGNDKWVTRPDDAPTPLAGLIATAVQHAGFQLLDRATVTKKIRMCRADDTEEATLYQALFTDTDVIP